ncbi:MAG: tetratricopeptide repeat protein, partial [Thermoleophilaceae bacterium]
AERGATLAAERGALDLREPFRNPSPPRLLTAAAVLLVALLAAWAIWQPEAADRATDDAVALADGGEVDAAIAKASDAADANPLSGEPLLVQAAIQTQAGRKGAARETLEDAVLKFPGDPETWYRLAAFQLGTLDRPLRAAETVRGALYLDPLSQPARSLFLEARARGREKAAEERRPRGERAED